MFLCPKCQKSMCIMIPEVHAKSFGNCEKCGKKAECFDCPGKDHAPRSSKVDQEGFHSELKDCPSPLSIHGIMVCRCGVPRHRVPPAEIREIAIDNAIKSGMLVRDPTSEDSRCVREGTEKPLHSPNCPCATISDKDLVSELRSMTGTLDDKEREWAHKLHAPLVDLDRKRAKKAYRRLIKCFDTAPRMPKASEACGSCRWAYKKCKTCSCCRECCRCPGRIILPRMPGDPKKLYDMLPRDLQERVLVELRKKGLAKRWKVKPMKPARIADPVEIVMRDDGIPFIDGPDKLQAAQRPKRWSECPHRPPMGTFSHSVYGPADAAWIGVLISGFGKTSRKEEMLKAIEAIRRRFASRKKPKEVVIEGVWACGARMRLPFYPGHSTGVIQGALERAWQTNGNAPNPIILVRVFHDDLLMREFDVTRDRYNLELD